ncbi:MAG: gamma-glutamyltransferase [Candidatus Aminicenantes bacterium RBG_16_63_16]|nr:MAG: gamma-glutamyltransferase [Candidatus Aminicenantes bacterium RBG_16_63_16]
MFFIILPALSLMSPGAQRTEKPVLHGKHWVAITGKPLAATAGAAVFSRGGNAVDAACAMLAAVSTMYDALSWGGETQALIFNPRTKKVVGVNALGVAPAGATPEFFRSKGLRYPPDIGPLAAVTPGTPGGLLVMLAEFGTMSLKDVLQPAVELADGYPIEAELAKSIEKNKKQLKEWPYSRKVLLPHEGQEWEAPEPGEVFRQPDLAQTLRKLIEAEAAALAAGKPRQEAIYAAYDRFYKGDIGAEFARGAQEQGGLLTAADLANWRLHLEEPVMTTYRGIDVYKLTCWVQGPVMLQALNMLESLDLKSLGYNSAEYIHALYQVMNLAFSDRDFYYGDPYFPPEEPLKGLLSKDYARERMKRVNWNANDPQAAPGDPYPFQGGRNPYLGLLEKWAERPQAGPRDYGAFFRGTTSIQAADEAGWVVSVTPSGGWIPACIAGRTGMGMSQRMQSFVLDPAENPFNVVAPGKRPRATLTPGLALKDGQPYLSFAVQGGDTQDQNLLQFFLNIVEFGMDVQQACEAPNVNSYQMRSSFGLHESLPGRIDLNERTPHEVADRLSAMGYRITFKKYTSGPINAIFFDRAHRTFWGGSSNYGEDYGIAW